MLKRGFPLPRGVTILKSGINFAIFARHATRVVLVVDIRRQEKTEHYEFELDPDENRTGDMWHILLDADLDDFSYGFRMDGPSHDAKGQKLGYDSRVVLMDPYSKTVMPRKWGTPAQYGRTPCSTIVSTEFDWQHDKPLKIPFSETIIYELHVRGFTRSPSSGVKAPGTYLGLTEKIPYLKELGITAVELLPVTEFDENDTVFHCPETGRRLKNFWGYSPVSFFALQPGYASDPGQTVNEFKQMVRTFHQAGIEVFLDIVYNHSGEGGYDGTTSSFRGIDNSIYYLLGKDGSYLNFSGCGNTLNCNHPVVRELIRDSLRYWVTEMHIDGFRFDLASILGRDQQGNVLPNPPMIEVIAEDPLLGDTKLIAEAWDAAGLYQVGSFSSDTRWAEWNGRYRDDVRSFLSGKRATVSHLATRIAGSSDLYQTSGRSPLCSINFLTSHDGFTLYDLVSYNDKHNLPNGEQNRDGETRNISWNSGDEGTTSDTGIIRLRHRRIKTFAAILLLSQGVPMLLGGDEFGRTQQGNNNAWCQDNDTGWVDWTLLEKNRDLHRFFKKCIALRKNNPIFRRDDFFTDEPSSPTASAESTISWQYLEPNRPDWSDDCHGLAFLLRQHLDAGEVCSFLVMLNGNRDIPLFFTVPAPRPGKIWRKIIDTAADSPADIVAITSAPALMTEMVKVLPFGCVVLQDRQPASGRTI
ncbi:glycogen debranching protein GlgX [Desulforhopalus singaporensis]|nr:glycogen debranching protein GlgX [Desulforhopalus singaporensis]